MACAPAAFPDAQQYAAVGYAVEHAIDLGTVRPNLLARDGYNGMAKDFRVAQSLVPAAIFSCSAKKMVTTSSRLV
jgi:hypothetical protein